MNFQEWLIQNGINSQEEWAAAERDKGRTEEEIAALWYRVVDLYHFENGN